MVGRFKLTFLVVEIVGLSPVSASRTVTLADYLNDSMMQAITAYTGPGGRISNMYRQSHRSHSGYDVIPEQQRGNPLVYVQTVYL